MIEPQQKILKDLVLYIYKGYMVLSTCENIWLQRLVLCHVLFPSHLQLMEEMIHDMVTNCIDMLVLPKLTSVAIVSTSFDLWM
jgi:hypothetical protein